MEDQILSHGDLLSQSRVRRTPYEFITCALTDITHMEERGWELHRKNRASARMRKYKPHGTYLEDRVWTLLYRMGFKSLSGPKGVILPGSQSGNAGSNQIDIVALDDESAIAVECKSMGKLGRRSSFQEELGKFKLLQERFTREVRKLPDTNHKRQIGLVMFLHNASLSEADLQRAREAKVIIFDTRDLEYFEQLAAHLGTASRYQFLADAMANRQVPGLAITVPRSNPEWEDIHATPFQSALNIC